MLLLLLVSWTSVAIGAGWLSWAHVSNRLTHLLHAGVLVAPVVGSSLVLSCRKWVVTGVAAVVVEIATPVDGGPHRVGVVGSAVAVVLVVPAITFGVILLRGCRQTTKGDNNY